jgi:hypothetical protein
VGVVGDDVINDLGEGARELGLRRILGEREVVSWPSGMRS